METSRCPTIGTIEDKTRSDYTFNYNGPKIPHRLAVYQKCSWESTAPKEYRISFTLDDPDEEAKTMILSDTYGFTNSEDIYQSIEVPGDTLWNESDGLEVNSSTGDTYVEYPGSNIYVLEAIHQGGTYHFMKRTEFVLRAEDQDVSIPPYSGI